MNIKKKKKNQNYTVHAEYNTKHREGGGIARASESQE